MAIKTSIERLKNFIDMDVENIINEKILKSYLVGMCAGSFMFDMISQNEYYELQKYVEQKIREQNEKQHICTTNNS